MDTSGRVRRGVTDDSRNELGRKRPRRSPSTSTAPEASGEGKSLEIKGLDGSTFELQVCDDATVEDVYKYTSAKIGLESGRKLLMTSGCIMLDYSRPLLQQVQGGEISFIVQRISLNDFAKHFWNAIQAETKECLTAEDVITIRAAAVVSIHLGKFPVSIHLGKFGDDLGGLTLPCSLQTLTFGHGFNKSLAGFTLPSSLQTLTFGQFFDHSLAGVTLPSSLQTLTFGERFSQSLAGVTLPSSLHTLTCGERFNQSLANVTLPSSLQTLTFGVWFDQSLAGVTFKHLELWGWV
ncbi:unnamed protein product [Cladocopium goreaui]|uniref:FNIP repeat-containing protein DDB_G0289381 n=1 Tax=Cladocopium goreaui TaxID=2562237 RepID=A0A9P1GR11_9DINO|nr:unnamed protein product [Cladocopium goreaui]